jgi:hypothetical protein
MTPTNETIQFNTANGWEWLAQRAGDAPFTSDQYLDTTVTGAPQLNK